MSKLNDLEASTRTNIIEKLLRSNDIWQNCDNVRSLRFILSLNVYIQLIENAFLSRNVSTLFNFSFNHSHVFFANAYIQKIVTNSLQWWDFFSMCFFLFSFSSFCYYCNHESFWQNLNHHEIFRDLSTINFTSMWNWFYRFILFILFIKSLLYIQHKKRML